LERLGCALSYEVLLELKRTSRLEDMVQKSQLLSRCFENLADLAPFSLLDLVFSSCP